MKAYVFPGQGSQKIGMGAELFDKYKDLIVIADEILGYSLKELCLEDSKGNLNNTQYTQPALFAISALMYLEEKDNNSIQADYLAGHSLGEYTALFASGALDFETGIRLVKKRGELMAQATNGAMAAILRLDENKIRNIITEHNLSGVDIANYNSLSQTVISGLEKDIDNSISIFTNEGGKCVKLNVSGAFHSRYMKEASIEFRKELDEITFNKFKIPVIANVDALPYDEENIKDNLEKQMRSSVRWTDTVKFLIEKGIDDIQEIGPGAVLNGLIKKIKKGQ